MHEKQQPADAQSITLRGVPVDVLVSIKGRVAEYNATHPGQHISQTDVVALAVREWVARGGQLPTPSKPG